MKSIKKNLIYQTLYQILIVILPLVTAPYVARVLGVDNAGIYSFSNTIANYFVIFGMLGLEQYGNRCIAKVRDNKDELNKVFSELLILHLLVATVAILLFFGYCFFFTSEYSVIFYLQSFYVISTLFDINWFFFGIENFRLTVARNTVIKVLSVAAIFLFVKAKEDLWIYTFILSISMLVSQIITWPLLRKYVRIVRVEAVAIKKHWKPLLVLFVAVIAANLNRMIDKAMLGWFDKISDLGCYDYADKIIRIPLGFIAAIGTVMLSKMANLFAQKEKKETERILDISACLVLLLVFGMGGGIAAIAPEFIILFLGKEFEETVVLLSVLAISVPLVGWNNYVRTQILIPQEMDVVYTRAVAVGAVVNIMVNCILIPLFGARGAAVATVVSYAIILLLQMFPIFRQTKGVLKYALFPLGAGVIMYIAVRLSSRITDRLFLSVCIEIFVGSVVYGGLSLLYLKMKQPHVPRGLKSDGVN